MPKVDVDAISRKEFEDLGSSRKRVSENAETKDESYSAKRAPSSVKV